MRQRLIATMRRAAVCCGLMVGFGWGVTGTAQAAPVAPGESLVDGDGIGALPTGEVLAEQTRSVTFEFELFTEGVVFEDGQGTMTATFTSEVIRESGRSGLTFVYRMIIDETLWEWTDARIASFAGFATDVEAEILGDSAFITRSADGATLGVKSNNDGLTEGGTLVVVRTDAESFDANGTMRFDVVGAFAVFEVDDPESTSIVSGHARERLGGVFRPASGDGNRPAVIPLPPALVPGLLTLGGVALARRIRTRRATRPATARTNPQ